ncbi:MAG: Sua5/YciO/YrdC/YwlC family protein [Lewinellaceae bacterium]|nr:Sua5/YciO/YrdC/YwlC family protein [Lewinellaceae bacterium]
MVINDYTSMLSYPEVQDLHKTLQSGGLILFPSDTVWAIGCDATQPGAIRRLNALKNRKPGDPFILLVDSIDMLKKYVRHVHPRIETLLYFHNRPLTVVYEEPENLPSEVLAADGTVAIRVVQDEFCRSFIQALGRPIVATTAHREPGRVPGHFGEIQSDILEGVDWVAKYRQKERHFEGLSVIARLDAQEELEFLRD